MTHAGSSTLYNDPRLSDIKIIQISEGNITEYFAHKAILANQSDWFANAFLGHFKEATAKEIELHNDDPKHFEIMMKFFYRHDWANQLSIGDEGIKGSDMDYRLEVIGVHNVADKYGFQLLKDSLAEKYTKIQDYLVEFRASEKVAVIRSHYDHCSSEECKLGDVIAKNLLDVAHKGNNLFLRNHKSLMKEYPKLASDLIMASSHNNYWRSIWG